MSDMDIPAFIDGQVEAIREAVGDEKALIAVSGGVDSTVSALLTYRALEENLVSVFIDDNYMRLGEPERVRQVLSSEPLNIPVRVLNERESFMKALEGLKDAEEKRKAFREAFYRTLSDMAEQEGCGFLVQGTIKADVDETSAGIKTQHNILQQIGIDPVEHYGFTVIEPLASLYKSQVREVARFMEVPPEIAERQPFPGPGLSIRVVGEITPEKLEELKKATFIVEEAFEPHGPSQFFAAIFEGRAAKELKVLKRDAAEMLGVEQSQVKAGFQAGRATGVIDGKRAYGQVAALGMTDVSGRPVDPGYETLGKILDYVRENYPEVTRLLWLVTEKEGEGFTIALRAVKTRDFLEAQVSEIPWQTLSDVAAKILDSCSGVTSVYYDVTPKPPATIEFE